MSAGSTGNTGSAGSTRRTGSREELEASEQTAAELELLRAATFWRASPKRHARLAELAAAVTLGDAFVRRAELHGILPLVLRNLRAAGAALSEPVLATLTERDRVLRGEARRDAVTVERLSTAARESGTRAVLLKGSSLAQDVYDTQGLRQQGDVDVLVPEDDVRSFVEALASRGLVEGEEALPVWWHRLVHFHLKLEPVLPMLKEVEVHWHLHHASRLFDVEAEDLLRRAHELEALPGVFALDPVDRFLHLAAHLTGHWVRIPGAASLPMLTSWLASDPPRIRLKWFLDLATAAEPLARGVAPASILARAESWGVQRELAFVCRCLDLGFPLDEDVRRWIAALQDTALEAQPGTAGSQPEHAPATDARAASRPLAGLDFRSEALAAWPRWFWPPTTYWQRRAPAWLRWPLRILHALGVLGVSLVGMLALPFALAARPFLRKRRAARREASRTPDRVLDLVAQWRGGGEEEEEGPARKAP